MVVEIIIYKIYKKKEGKALGEGGAAEGKKSLGILRIAGRIILKWDLKI